jgi:hypothetical protein
MGPAYRVNPQVTLFHLRPKLYPPAGFERFPWAVRAKDFPGIRPERREPLETRYLFDRIVRWINAGLVSRASFLKTYFQSLSQ